MNFYKRHIGDYIKDAGHLTLLEHGVYARLMDVYYTREEGIPEDKAARLIGARTKEELQALKNVLAEFFNLDGDTWIQSRCEREIEAASAKAEKNRENGKRGGRPKEEKTETVSKTETEENPDGSDLGNHVGSKNNLSQTPDSRLQTPDKEAAEVSSNATSAASRVGEICVFLRRHGINTSPQHLSTHAWAANPAVTDELLTTAIAKAKKQKPNGDIHPNYLKPIVEDLLTPLPDKPRAEPAWDRSDAGIDAKAREMGMTARGGESYRDFAARIRTEIEKRSHEGARA